MSIIFVKTGCLQMKDYLQNGILDVILFMSDKRLLHCNESLLLFGILLSDGLLFIFIGLPASCNASAVSRNSLQSDTVRKDILKKVFVSNVSLNIITARCFDLVIEVLIR